MKLLARKGAVVIMACRSIERGEKAKNHLIQDLTSTGNNKISELRSALNVEKNTTVDDLREELGKRLIVKKLDLGSLQSVKDFGESVIRDFAKLDSCIYNAGVAYVPYKLSQDGIESHIAINHV